jgi:hypothetical protein
MDTSLQTQALLAAFRIQLPDPDRHLLPQYPSQFTVFPKLPIELRLNIWKHAFPAPRHVELVGSCVFGPVDFLGTRGTQHRKLNHLQNEFPVTLSINSESRQETMKHYKLLFVKEDLARKGKILCRCSRGVDECLKVLLWINLVVDTAYVSYWLVT